MYKTRYNYTQAQLKNGTEALLGLKRRKRRSSTRSIAELAKKLEKIAHDLTRKEIRVLVLLRR